MGKAQYLFFMLSGFLILSYYMGFLGGQYNYCESQLATQPKTCTSSLLWYALHPTEISISAIAKFVIVAIASIGTGLVVGFLFQNFEIGFRASIYATVFSLFTDAYIIYDKIIIVSPVVKTISLIIFAPIMLTLFIFVLIDFITGRD